MKEITIREAQLLVLAVNHHKAERVVLNDLQRIRIGDNIYISEINLKSPFVTITMEREGGDSSLDSDAPICKFSDEVVSEIIQTMRDIAYQLDIR